MVIAEKVADRVSLMLYEAYISALTEIGLQPKTGIFQAYMQVELLNDGPVTILLDSKKTF
jgi:D-tyrosyl-tRNA(Tyr) deacylase